jgi:hypothetical protein
MHRNDGSVDDLHDGAEYSEDVTVSRDFEAFGGVISDQSSVIGPSHSFDH